MPVLLDVVRIRFSHSSIRLRALRQASVETAGLESILFSARLFCWARKTLAVRLSVLERYGRRSPHRRTCKQIADSSLIAPCSPTMVAEPHRSLTACRSLTRKNGWWRVAGRSANPFSESLSS